MGSSPGARTSSPTFVGRQPELATVADALGQVQEGATTTVVLGGEAGVGKSRLVAEAAERARAMGARVTVGSSLEVGDGSVPYSAVVEALRGLTDEIGVDPLRRLAGDTTRELRPLLPALGRPGPSDGDLGGPSERSGQVRLFEAVLRLLDRLAAERPLMLALEDLHWADASTRELFTYLVHNLRDSATLLIATYRSDELHRTHPLRPMLAELVRHERVRRIELAPFERDELIELVQGITGAPPARDTVERILARSEGNPFFVEELLAARAGEGSALPDTLREILLTALASLPDASQRVLRVAAAAGRRVQHELLARVTDLPDTELDEALRAAVERGVLVPDSTSGTYSFRHALFAEAARSTLLPGERTRLHRRIGEVLQAEPALAVGAPAAELAHHWHAAGDQARALTASVEAAQEAESLHAFIEARHHVERALELWEAVDEPDRATGLDHPAVLRWAARVSYLSGEVGRAVSILERALSELAADVDAATEGTMYGSLGRYRLALGDAGAAEVACARAVELIPAAPSAARAQALATYSSVLLLNRSLEASLAHSEEAVRIAREVGDRVTESRALANSGSAHADLGHLDDGVAEVKRARSIAEQLHAAEDVVRTHVHLSSALIRGGRLIDGANEALDGLERSRELGVERLFGSMLAGNATSGLFHAGRWDEAAELLVEVMGDSFGVGWLSLLQARLSAHRGRFDAARSALADAQGARADGDPRYHAVALAIPLLEEDHDAAHRLVLDRPDPSGRAHAGTINELRAWALRAVADRLHARDDVDPGDARSLADELLDETTDRHGAGIVHARAWQLNAIAEHTRLADRPDADAWERTVAAWDEIGWVYQAAYARYRLAEALAADDRPGVAEHLEAALEVATHLGAVPLTDAIGRLARRNGVPSGLARRRTASADRPYGLTPRELEILALVADGRRNREIGEELHITVKTVSVHVTNILRKLGVSSRTEAAALTHREGLTLGREDRS